MLVVASLIEYERIRVKMIECEGMCNELLAEHIGNEDVGLLRVGRSQTARDC